MEIATGGAGGWLAGSVRARRASGEQTRTRAAGGKPSICTFSDGGLGNVADRCGVRNNDNGTGGVAPPHTSGPVQEEGGNIRR